VNIVMSRGGLRRRVLNSFLFMSSIGPQTRIPGISYTGQKHLRYAKIHGIMFDPAPLKSLFLRCASSSSLSGISWGPLSYLCRLLRLPSRNLVSSGWCGGAARGFRCSGSHGAFSGHLHTESIVAWVPHSGQLVHLHRGRYTFHDRAHTPSSLPSRSRPPLFIFCGELLSSVPVILPAWLTVYYRATSGSSSAWH